MRSVPLRPIHFRLAVAVAVAVTLYFALTPETQTLADRVPDKVNHFVAFIVLSLLSELSFPANGFDMEKVVGLLAFGAGIEVAQHFIPYRDASRYDLAADGIGIAGGLLVRRHLWRHGRNILRDGQS